VLVLAGVFIFLRRRLHDPGALAVERSGDFLALAGLFAVSVTGLFLTVSSTWLDGRFYSALNTIHALTVILGLMYLPFGKLFHIFQRPGNLGVAYYKQPTPRATRGLPAVRRRLRQRPADRRPQGRAPQVGFDYTIDGATPTTNRTTTRTPARVPAGLGHAGADRSGRRFRLMARTRSPTTSSSRPIRAPPQRGPARRGGTPGSRSTRSSRPTAASAASSAASS
jgi:hypothetical protein